MANAGLIDPVANPDPNRGIDISDDFTVPSSTLDPPFFFDGLGFDDEDGDFEFNLDHLSLPSDTEPFVVGDFDFMKEVHFDDDDRIDLARFGIGTVIDSNSTVSVDRTDLNFDDNKGIEIVDFSLFKNVVDASVGGENLRQCEGSFGNASPSYEGNGPASSHGSGTCGVGFDGVNYSSPEAVSNCDKDVLGANVDCEIEKEVLGKRSMSKRNKESGEGKIGQRSNKLRRSSERSDKCGSSGNEDDEKKKARMMRNRESAQHSRQRKKQYVEELEAKIRMMQSTIADLNHRVSFVVAENTGLRQQLGSGGMYPPPPGMYPHMPYPWMPYPPYVGQPQGSQVPPIPIPRLKPRQPSKSKNSTKKVASISLLGLLVFIFLFGVLVPLMNIRYDGTGPHIHYPHKDRILITNGHRDGSEFMLAPATSDRLSIHDNHLHTEESRSGERKNSSEPLSVSLYVPRNDRLLKIDGNLIIHSFLASEKATSSYMTPENVKQKKLSTAIISHSSPALTYSEARNDEDRNPTERQRALGSGTGNTSPNHGKATFGEGRLHQWFHEGLEGINGFFLFDFIVFVLTRDDGCMRVTH